MRINSIHDHRSYLGVVIAGPFADQMVFAVMHRLS